MLSGTLEMVRVELDLIVHQTRTELLATQGMLLPYYVTFTIQDLSPTRLQRLLIQYYLRSHAEQIDRETNSDLLKMILSKWPVLDR